MKLTDNNNIIEYSVLRYKPTDEVLGVLIFYTETKTARFISFYYGDDEVIKKVIKGIVIDLDYIIDLQKYTKFFINDFKFEPITLSLNEEWVRTFREVPMTYSIF